MTRVSRLATLLPLVLAGRTLAAQHPADVRFMQGMIGHHAQALEMSALVPARTSRPEMRMLAERIDVSQRDEIAMMRSWLERHHQPLPDSGGHRAHDMQHGAMPGMLNAAELDTLRAATGAAFDRHFLRYMIRHHEGALVMVKTLLAQPGAGQESEVFRFASDVDTDQRAEIARMRRLVDSYAPRSTGNSRDSRGTSPLPTPAHHHP